MWALVALLALAPAPLAGPLHQCARAPAPLPLLMRAADEPAGGRAVLAKRLRSMGTALATAAVLATPRGPARAAQQELRAPDATPVTRTVGDARRDTRQPQLAFLGWPRKKQLEPVYRGRPPAGDGIDLDKILPKSYGHRFTDRDFIFSESLTAKSPLEEELEDLETYKEQSKGTRALQTLATTGGAVGLVYLSVKGLTNVEKWIKNQELKDMQEEMDLTGTYISVDASDVDSAIDPTTGKNLTISRPGKSSKVPGAADDAEDAPKQAPWLLRVLGLGDTAAADDDDFWEPATPSTLPKPKGSGGEGGAAGPDGEGGDEDDDDEEDDDDSSGIDTLDDLMG